jgi:hypothetical protein
LKHLKRFLAGGGIVFWRFLCLADAFWRSSADLSEINFVRCCPLSIFSPTPVYRAILLAFKEDQSCIDELIDIKQCRVSIEKFEKLLKANDYVINDRCLWFINPRFINKNST